MDLLVTLWNGDGQIEVLTQWARLRRAGYDPEDIYCSTLPTEEVDIVID